MKAITVIIVGVPALLIVLGFFAYVSAYTLDFVGENVGMQAFGFYLILSGIMIYLAELLSVITKPSARSLSQDMKEYESKEWKGAIYVIEVGAALSLVGVFLLMWSSQTSPYGHPIVANITLISVFSLMLGMPILAVGIIAYLVTRKKKYAHAR